MDIVSPALNALPKVYAVTKALWKFYQTTQAFGNDFEVSMVGFHSQEWIFSSHLELYIFSTKEHDLGKVQTRPEQQHKDQQVTEQITVIVELFNDCYKIIKKYDTECVHQGVCTHGQPVQQTIAKSNADPDLSGSHREYQVTSVVGRPRRKLQKRVDGTRIEDSAVKYFVYKNSEARIKAAEKESRNAIHYSSENVVFEPRVPQAQSNSNPSSSQPPRSLAAHNERMKYRKKRTQGNARALQPSDWAFHGKDEFESLVLKLKHENEVLRALRPLLLPKDPFKKLRPFKESPQLWKETQHIRDELNGLHAAIQGINQGNQSLTLVVKLEEELDDTRARIEEAGFLDGLQLTYDPMLVWLMPKFEASGPSLLKAGEFILSTTIAKGQHFEIGSLPRKLAEIGASGNKSSVLGKVTLGPERIYHLQTISNPDDLVGGHYVSNIVEDIRLRSEERICLAAQMAQSYIHFMSINHGAVHRHLGSYQIFGQSAPENEDDWGPEVLSSMWVEFNFGKSRQMGSGKLKSRSEFRENKIDPAVELGVMIYQVTACHELEYEFTASGLKSAQWIAKSNLKDVEDNCGGYMRDVIETCFLDRRGEFKEQKIVEEVASALKHIADLLKN